ncbi:hypothetical protein M569_15005, partial [Genlisea aurea]
ESFSDTSETPVTPAGRLFLQETLNHVINCAIIGEFPLASVDSIKAEIANSVILKNPRFCSLMVRDSSGRENWIRTRPDIDRHVVVRRGLLSEDSSLSDDDVVNDYVAGLTYGSPLPADKPLWEVHVLVEYRAVVFRLHHALGDGVSLMSVLLSCCRRMDDPAKAPEIGGGSLRREGWSFWVWVKVAWFSFVYGLELALRAMWRRDETTALSGGAGVEQWPRRVATARFRLEDMKIVKKAVPGATINDVLFGVLSIGFSRYLSIRSPKALDNGVGITGMAMVNLRQQYEYKVMLSIYLSIFLFIILDRVGIRMGNKFGMILLPNRPLDAVKRAKEMIDKKKLSLEAVFSYKLLHFITETLGPKVAGILNYRVFCNTTFTISNIVGPKEKISLAGNPLKSIRVTSSSLPHVRTYAF